MKTIPTTLLVAAAVAFAAPAVAQDDASADTTEPMAAPAADETPPADDTAAPDQPAKPAAPSHDWEFMLSPTPKATGARGTVKVTEGEDGNTFAVETSGLPVVDSLDTPEKDVNAYTVWVVPSKDRVAESTFAGVLTIDAESGEGSLEASTGLDTFGIIVTATADGAPERIGGVPVLTGIPVRSPATPAESAPPSEGEAPAAEPSETPAPGDQPDAESAAPAPSEPEGATP